MRLSRPWSLVAVLLGLAAGAMFASSNAEARALSYCESDECVNWYTCIDVGILPIGCDKVYGSPFCQTYYCH